MRKFKSLSIMPIELLSTKSLMKLKRMISVRFSPSFPDVFFLPLLFVRFSMFPRARAGSHFSTILLYSQSPHSCNATSFLILVLCICWFSRRSDTSKSSRFLDFAYVYGSWDLCVCVCVCVCVYVCVCVCFFSKCGFSPSKYRRLIDKLVKCLVVTTPYSMDTCMGSMVH